MNRAKVLVVDDQPDNLMAMRALLSRLSVDVLLASSGAEALELLDDDLALVLLDVRMPEMDGYETALHIRQRRLARPVPIVFLTAEDRSPERRVRGYEAGAVDFLYKPVESGPLCSKVQIFCELAESRRELAAAEAEQRRRAAWLNQLLDAVDEGVIGVSGDGRITLANPHACELLRTTGESLVGQELATLLGVPDRVLHEVRLVGSFRHDDGELRRLDGSSFAAEYSLTKVDVGEPDSDSVLVFKDITRRKNEQALLRSAAEIDHLTGLPNRLVLERTLETFAAHVGRGLPGFAVLMIDLDGFKPINDTHGHEAGDRLLQHVAEILRSSVRAGDLCARLGGDEFVVVLSHLTEVASACEVARKLLERLDMPVPVSEGLALRIGASIGLAMFPDDGATVAQCLRAADAAMYAAKRQARQGGSLPIAVAAKTD